MPGVPHDDIDTAMAQVLGPIVDGRLGRGRSGGAISADERSVCAPCDGARIFQREHGIWSREARALRAIIQLRHVRATHRQ